MQKARQFMIRKFAHIMDVRFGEHCVVRSLGRNVAKMPAAAREIPADPRCARTMCKISS
ncbi:hypothetical protein GCM10025857_01120 [Alicyclobacillus contaminans]|nr:hypothetical protein GCM10025857_01120 [Alicyclobacillus contaminans]